MRLAFAYWILIFASFVDIGYAASCNDIQVAIENKTNDQWILESTMHGSGDVISASPQDKYNINRDYLYILNPKQHKALLLSNSPFWKGLNISIFFEKSSPPGHEYAAIEFQHNLCFLSDPALKIVSYDSRNMPSSAQMGPSKLTYHIVQQPHYPSVPAIVNIEIESIK